MHPLSIAARGAARFSSARLESSRVRLSRGGGRYRCARCIAWRRERERDDDFQPRYSTMRYCKSLPGPSARVPPSQFARRTVSDTSHRSDPKFFEFWTYRKNDIDIDRILNLFLSVVYNVWFLRNEKNNRTLWYPRFWFTALFCFLLFYFTLVDLKNNHIVVTSASVIFWNIPFSLLLIYIFFMQNNYLSDYVLQ